MAVVLLVGIQGRLNPVGMIGRVGIFLALETHTYVLGIFETMLADDVGIGTDTLEVSAINLYTGLVGKHLHEDARLRRVEAGANLSVIALTVFIGVQAEIMVITCGVLNLIEVGLNAIANGVWGTEVHWGAFH